MSAFGAFALCVVAFALGYLVFAIRALHRFGHLRERYGADQASFETRDIRTGVLLDVLNEVI